MLTPISPKWHWANGRGGSSPNCTPKTLTNTGHGVPDTSLPPGGETFEELCTRVGGALHRVLDRCEEEGLSRALVVCHGGVLRASIQTLIGISPEALMPIDPGSLTIIRVRQTDAGRDPRLQRLNWVPRPL